MVNTVAPEQRESMTELQLQQLPLSRRNVQNILVLGTGVDTSDGGGVRLNGLGRSGVKITVDGTDATSNPENPGTAMYQSFNYINIMSIEAVQEVQTVKGVTAAEYGNQLSGNVNLITKSGTNSFHGSLFESFRAEDLNAKERRLATRAPFTFNQYGGSIGGPVKRDKIFFFGAYEGYQESAFSIVQGDVPTQKFRDEAIQAQPVYKSFFDTLYLPNQPTAPGADTGRYIGAASQRRHDNHVTSKGDIRVTNTSNLSLTYSRSRPYRLSPEGRTQAVNSRSWSGISERGQATYVTGGAAWSSETRFGYNLNDITRLDGWWNAGLAPGVKEQFYGGRRLPAIGVTGSFGNGGGGETVNFYGPVWSAEQKFALHAGQHSFKFGGIYQRREPGRFDIENPSASYANKADFLANIPQQIQFTLGSNRFTSKSHEFGFFAQDDWRITSNLVINLGIRYDFFGKYIVNPTDPEAPAYLYNLNGLLDNKFHFGPVRDKLDPFDNDAGVNLGPRLGFAYNVAGRGKTVVRGGFGILFAPQPWDTMANAVGKSVTVPFRLTSSRTELLQLGLKYPAYNEDALRVASTGNKILIADTFDPHIQSPYSMNVSLGFEHAITNTLMLESAFVGNRGVKFRLYRTFNLPDRVTDLRPNSDMGQGNYLCSCQNTLFTSWQTSLRKRYSKNLSMDAHYTWGKALSYTGGDTGASFSGDAFSTVQDFFDIRSNRGPSAGDVTHRFVADFIYELPWLAKSANIFARSLLAGWQVSGLFTARSGGAATLSQSGLTSRPDYIGGNTINPNWRNDGIYLNRQAFAMVPLGPGRNPIRPGNVGVGAIRGPAASNLDLSLSKSFSIVERVKLQIRADAYNALNHTPYSGFTTSINSAIFGAFTSNAGARQVQLNARLTF
jgi:Outer membrane receptor proteins, mostly Fe transport